MFSCNWKKLEIDTNGTINGTNNYKMKQVISNLSKISFNYKFNFLGEDDKLNTIDNKDILKTIPNINRIRFVFIRKNLSIYGEETLNTNYDILMSQEYKYDLNFNNETDFKILKIKI